MPMIKSKSKKAIGENIATEMKAGKPKNQSIAIALDVARKAGEKITKKGKKEWMLKLKKLKKGLLN